MRHLFALLVPPFAERRDRTRGVCRVLLLSAASLYLAACGGAGTDTVSPTPTPPPVAPAPVTPGLLGLTITGLPAGVNADVSVVGVNAAAFSRSATSSTGWTDVPPGRYTITVRPVRAAAGTFAATPSTDAVTVTAANAATVTIAYKPLPSQLAVDISGLPGGASAAVAVTSPSGATQTLTQSTVVGATPQDGAEATPDRWQLDAREVTSGGTRFLPTPATLDTTVRLGDTARVAVRYGVASGAIAIVVRGLPTGASADARLIAPDNSTRPVTGTTTITGLDAGRYLLVSRAIARGGLSFAPDADTLSLEVARSLVATPATVTYIAQAGRLSIRISGLPNGANADATLSSAAGTRTISGNASFDSLPAGDYTLSAAAITHGGERYVPDPASQALTVSVGGATTASVAYEVAPTSVDVVVSGLPGGAAAAITLTNPAGQSVPVTASTSLPATVLGRWRLTASDVESGGHTYSPSPASYEQVVAAGDRIALPVQYAVSTGGIAVVVAGLPTGANGAVVITGPRNFSTALTSTTTLTGLPPGSYTITASAVTISGVVWLPVQPTQSVSVSKSVIATPATVTYAQAAGAIAIAVNGVGAGGASISVAGPNGYSQAVTGPITLTGLAPGTYTLTATSATVGGNTFTALPTTQAVSVGTSPTPVSATVTYTQTTGSLALAVLGLPTGANGSVSITGPNAFSRTVGSTTTLTGLAPGTYTVTAFNVTITGNVWSAAPASQSVSVTATAVAAPATVSYVQNPGTIALTVTGVPNGTSAAVTVTGSNNYSQNVTGSTTLTNVPPGSYTISAANVTASGNIYAPSVATQTVTVAGGASTAATVAYSITTGSLTVTVNNVPGGSSANVTVTGPAGFSRTVSATTTLTTLTPGSYTIAAASITNAGNTFSPSPSSQSATVSASPTAATATVTYAQTTGSLALAVLGLPNGSNGNVTITGPNSFSQALTSTTTLTGLAPGSYTVAAANVTIASNQWVASPASQTVTVTTSAVAAPATVTYAQNPGSLAITISGLPNGTAAALTVTGPNSYSQAVTANTTLNNLSAGSYTVSAANVTASGNSYAPNIASQAVTVGGGATASASVTYAITTGSLALTVTGVPGGSNANITVSGPSGYSRAVTASTTLTTLTPGSYTITAANISVSSNTYGGTPASQTVTVNASANATSASVTYAITTGSLALTVSGLPGGTSAAITVTGPNAFSQNVTGTTTLATLTPGSYTISASSVAPSGTTYNPTPTSATVTVSASPTAATATVTYAASGGGGGGTNYTISGAYFTQAIQKPDGSVAMVANRDALLRVFVTATAANTARPDVRVRIYDGATLLSTNTITAPEASVRTATAEGTLSSTWNLLVPAANVRTTMKVLVDLDPTSAITDSDRSDNSWPLNGTPATVAVRSVPTFTVRFVPVLLGGLTGNVSAANKESFLATARKVWPVQNVVSDVHATFTSSATALQSDDANNNWSTILSEINSLRVTEGAPSTMHYYGVVKTNYTSGVAGYGYQPGKAAVGWDYLPSGDGVAAHEWGHNFSRAHAPCGVSGDPNYPYAGGVTNYWGWNSGTNALVSPTSTDLMSYCSNNWVSDYNWTAVLNYRSVNPIQASALSAGSTAKQEGLLVWGRVVNGVIQLEPAFRVTAPVTPAAARPTHRLDLLDDAGNAMLQLPIEASVIDHAEGRTEQQFAVVVPWSAALEDRLQQIRVADPRAPLRSVSRRASQLSPAAARAAGRPAAQAVATVEPSDVVTREGASRVRVSWRNAGIGMAMVRDAANGQVLGFVRGQAGVVATGGRAVEIVYSDGVRSTVKSLR